MANEENGDNQTFVPERDPRIPPGRTGLSRREWDRLEDQEFAEKLAKRMFRGQVFLAIGTAVLAAVLTTLLQHLFNS